jgi:transposase InsO family protein
LERQHDCSLSLSTIQKVLQKHQVKPLQKIRRRKEVKRYQCDIPGERIQMDTCKIGPGVYQYTAVDDCTRYKVVAIYPRVCAKNTLQFLEKLIEETPFPIQRIQTDRGKEFFAYQVQETLMDWGIKFRPIRPRSPHLNGKVERAQKTDLEEFYSTVDIKQPDLGDRLQEWQHYYNWDRVHGTIGKPPIDKFFELSSRTPFWDEVIEKYDPDKEHIQEQDYKAEERLRGLKRSL